MQFCPKTQKYPVFLSAAILAAAFLTGCSASGGSTSAAQSAPSGQSTDQISETGFYFDTVVSLTLNGTDDQEIIQECFSLMADYEALLSRTRENSDIWNINHSQGAPTQVSEETASLLQTALGYCEISGGAFDITIAPVSILWDFQGEEPHSIPNQDKLNEALTHVDYRNIEIDGQTVTLKDPKAAIDLGGIAKGYIADRLRDLLTERGVASGFIDLGGNILTFGEKPNGKPWKIGIRKPFGEAAELIATVTGEGRSVVTSGTYERYFEKNGTIFHHILDPANGYPVENGLTSVTILSDSSAEGDALSTTCFGLGLEDGMELIESLEGIEALFITDDMELHRSSGFPAE